MTDPSREDDPLALFRSWYEAAAGAEIDKPNAMTLATVGLDDRPKARIVLLSSFDERGLVFHTNYLSAKGRELERVPWAALVFWWDPLGWQVRVEGRVEKTSGEESDAYFAGRPRGSQIGAWASAQSEAIAHRGVLEAAVEEYARRFAHGPVPRPPHWGGYRVVPDRWEFWIAREDRLHDRFAYDRNDGGGWYRRRLAP